jgi:type IV pilus assembly protein PilN
VSSLVTINLLPPKKKKVGTGRILLAVCGVVWLVAAGYVGWMYVDTKQQMQAMQQRIELKEKQLAAVQQKRSAASGKSTLEQYLALSDKLQRLFYPTSLVMDELARNLPVQGKLAKVTYHLDGKVTLEGKFEQYDDIAAYLHNLQQSPYVRKASVTSIAKVEVKWVGPVDDQGNPLSVALQTVGSKLLPRANASFEIWLNTFDVNRLAAKPTDAPQAQKQDGQSAITPSSKP